MVDHFIFFRLLCRMDCWKCRIPKLLPPNPVHVCIRLAHYQLVLDSFDVLLFMFALLRLVFSTDFRARKINYISIWLFGFIYPSYKVIIIFWLKKKEIKLNKNEKYNSFIFWGALTVCSCFAISGKSSIYVVFKDLFIALLN